MSQQVKGRAGKMVRRSPALLWVIALCGIGLWMAHITAVSSLVEFACNEKGTLWWLHVATAVTALPTALAVWVCWGLVRRSEDPENKGTLAGNYTFAGVFGLITGGFSLLLILVEGSYVFFLNPCA